jgi:ketosteroid isomerase-like protein
VSVDEGVFTAWLQRYCAAWEQRDGHAAARLFTEDAEYYWTPFDPPKRGRAEIARAWNEATARQRSVRVASRVVAVTGNAGIATWRTRFERAGAGYEVQIDGILIAELDESAQCRVFREWWHTTEQR